LSLIDYAKTDRQRQTIITWEECGRNSGMVAAKLGISCSTVRDHIAYVKNTAAAAGYSDNWDAKTRSRGRGSYWSEYLTLKMMRVTRRG
jgi:predicted ArsR family transcriptional regulator